MVKNKADDYTQYWKNPQKDNRMSGSFPEVRIFVSKQKKSVSSTQKSTESPTETSKENTET